LENECRDGVFIDVGANIGYYSLVLAKKTGCRVIAVEPNPPALERLKFNVKINENIKDQITIVPLGIGSHGEFEIHSEGNLGAASLHKKIFNEPKNGVKIKTKPLLEILKELGVKRVDALKIDIEGMEDQALAPYLKNVSPEMLPKCIVIEDDHQDLWEVDLMKNLFDLGYKEISRTRSNAILHRAK